MAGSFRTSASYRMCSQESGDLALTIDEFLCAGMNVEGMPTTYSRRIITSRSISPRSPWTLHAGTRRLPRRRYRRNSAASTVQSAAPVGCSRRAPADRGPRISSRHGLTNRPILQGGRSLSILEQLVTSVIPACRKRHCFAPSPRLPSSEISRVCTARPTSSGYRDMTSWSKMRCQLLSFRSSICLHARPSAAITCC